MTLFCLLVVLGALEEGLGYTIIQRPAHIDQHHENYHRFTSHLGHQHLPLPPPPDRYWFDPPPRLARDETHNLLELYYLIRVIGEYRQPVVAHKTKLDDLVEELQDQDLHRKLQRLLNDAEGFDEIRILGRYPHGQSTLDLLDKRSFVNDYRQLIPVIHRILDAIDLDNEMYYVVREKLEELKEHVNELTVSVVQKEMDLYQELTATTERTWSIADILETIFGKQDQTSMAALEEDYDIVVEDDDGKPMDSGEVEEFWVVIEDSEEDASKEELDKGTHVDSVEVSQVKEESMVSGSELSSVVNNDDLPVVELPTYSPTESASDTLMVVPESVLPAFIYNRSSELSQEKLNNNEGASVLEHTTAAVDEANVVWENQEEYVPHEMWVEDDSGEVIENSEHTEDADDADNNDSFEFKEENYERLTPEEEESDALPTEDRGSDSFEFEESKPEHSETHDTLIDTAESTLIVESKDDSSLDSKLVASDNEDYVTDYQILTKNENLDPAAFGSKGESPINASFDDFDVSDNGEAATVTSTEVVNSLTFPEELKKTVESTEPIVDGSTQLDFDPRVDSAGFPAHYNQPNVVFESERLPNPIDVSQPADLIEPEEEEVSLQETTSKSFVESETGMLLEPINSLDLVDAEALADIEGGTQEGYEQQIENSYEDYSEEVEQESVSQSVPLWLKEDTSAADDENLQELEESQVNNSQQAGELNVYEVHSNQQNVEVREEPLPVRTAEFDPNALRYVTDEIIKMVALLEESDDFPGLRERISNQDLDQVVDRLSQVEIMKMVGDQGINRIEMITALQKLIMDKNLEDRDRIVNVLELWKDGEDPKPDEGYFSKNYGADTVDDVESRVMEEVIEEVAEDEELTTEELVDEFDKDSVSDVETQGVQAVDTLEQFPEQREDSQPDEGYFSKNYGVDVENVMESRVLEVDIGETEQEIANEEDAQQVDELVHELEEDIVDDVELQGKESVDDLKPFLAQNEGSLTHDRYFEKNYGVNSDREIESRVVEEMLQAVTNLDEAQNAEELIDELEEDILEDAELHYKNPEQSPEEEAPERVTEGIHMESLYVEETEPSTEEVESRIVTGVEQVELHHVNLQGDSDQHGKDRDRIEVLSEEMPGFLNSPEMETERASLKDQEPSAYEETQAPSASEDVNAASIESKSDVVESSNLDVPTPGETTESDPDQSVASSVGKPEIRIINSDDYAYEEDTDSMNNQDVEATEVSQHVEQPVSTNISQEETEENESMINTAADLTVNDSIEAGIESSPIHVLKDETVFTAVGDDNSSVPQEPVFSGEVVDDVKRERVQPFPDDLPDKTEPLAVDRASADEGAMSEREKELLADERQES